MRRINEILAVVILSLIAVLVAAVGMRLYDNYIVDKQVESEIKLQEEVLSRNREAHDRVQEMRQEIQELSGDREKLGQFLEEIRVDSEEAVPVSVMMDFDASGMSGNLDISEAQGVSENMLYISGNAVSSTEAESWSGNAVSSTEAESWSGNTVSATEGESWSGNAVSSTEAESWSGNTVNPSKDGSRTDQGTGEKTPDGDTLSGRASGWQDGDTISGSTIGGSGNRISVSENRVSVSGNMAGVSENRVSVSGNMASVSENRMSVSGNMTSVSDNSLSVSGNGAVSENTTISGNGTLSGNMLDLLPKLEMISPAVTLAQRRQIRSSLEETLLVNWEDQACLEERCVDFSGKKIACLGDSITAAANLEGEAGYLSYSYPAVLKELLGAEEVYNLGIGGSSIGRYWSDAFVERYKQIPEDTDIIIVMGGTNDGFCLSEKEFGNFTERRPWTFCGDLDELMRGLKENYPDADIFFVTPLPNILQDYLMRERTYLLPQKNVANVILTLSAAYDIKVIDLYNSNILDSHDADVVADYMPDGVHANKAGYRILAEHIAAELVRSYE